MMVKGHILHLNYCFKTWCCCGTQLATGTDGVEGSRWNNGNDTYTKACTCVGGGVWLPINDWTGMTVWNVMCVRNYKTLQLVTQRLWTLYCLLKGSYPTLHHYKGICLLLPWVFDTRSCFLHMWNVHICNNLLNACSRHEIKFGLKWIPWNENWKKKFF